MSFNKEEYLIDLYLRKSGFKNEYSQFLKTAKNDVSSCFMREN